MSLPLVSVVIPVFNGERFLREALVSALTHDYAPLEINVIDDGSTDDSAEIARSYSGVRYEVQINQGNAAARNRGIAIARGDLIALLDQDDRWRPGKLRHQVDALLTQPEAGYSLCYCELLVESGMTLPPAFDPESSSKPFPAYVPSALLMHRRTFDRVGPFDSAYRFGNDSDWFSRATDAGVRCAMLTEAYLEKRVHHWNQGHDVPAMRHDLMRVVRASVARKRRAGQKSN